MIVRPETAGQARPVYARGAGDALGDRGAARPPGARWKRHLRDIFAPAFRLHHYRNAHNRLLQRALCEIDRDANAC